MQKFIEFCKMENKSLKPKQISQNPSRRISLKDIPPLDPSSIPFNPPLRPRRRMVPVDVKEVEKNIVESSCSGIQTMHVPKPKEESKGVGLDKSKKGSAKSVLNEICISNRWEHPVYECCNVEGPSHMRLFTYKVVVETKKPLEPTFLECFSDPKRTKKAAAEQAAEAAVWYLENVRRIQKKPKQ